MIFYPMRVPAEALSALCNGEIRGTTLPSRLVGFVCLSVHGDSRPVLLVEQSLLYILRSRTHKINYENVLFEYHVR